MDGDMEEAEDERTIELSSLAAIFPELTIRADDPFSADIDIPVEPAKPLRVGFEPPKPVPLASGYPTPPSSTTVTSGKQQVVGLAGTTTAAQALGLEAVSDQDRIELSHLPPLHLVVRLPKGYPTEAAPIFSVSTSPPWLPEKVSQDLLVSGKNLWEELGKDQVVFAYIDLIREAAERAFDLGLEEPFGLPLEFQIPLLDFNRTGKRAKFDQGTFDCGVCLEPKKGFSCYRLSSCGHVFCTDCLQSFYTTCIDEGDICSVKCLDPGCGKDDQSSATIRSARRPKTIPPSELLNIPLPEETVKRYATLRRKRALESAKSTVFCPRPWCQGPARTKASLAFDVNQDYELSESESEAVSQPESEPSYLTADGNPPENSIRHAKRDPKEDRLVICADCSFAFCAICKASWHGPLVFCRPRNKEELNDAERASEQYLNLHTTPCPTCDARAQKTGGCNHMICGQCKTHFCYLCSSWLDSNNPYEHFNNKKKSCYQRLWELEAGDGDDVGAGYFGGGVGEDMVGNPYVDEIESETDSDDSNDDDLSDDDDDDDGYDTEGSLAVTRRDHMHRHDHHHR